MQDLNIALVQMNQAWESPAENLAMAARHIEGIGQKVDLIVLPEMFTTGFTMNAPACAQTMDGSGVQWMKKTARLTGTDIAGSMIIAGSGRFYNRLVWAKPDGSVQVYDKRHLFRMAGEHTVYTGGSANITVELNGWRVRPFICYDLRFPVWTRNKGRLYDLALFVASWPAKRAAHWNALLRARAIENQSFVIGVNRTGTDGNGVAYAGGTAAFDFAGIAIADAAGAEGVSVILLQSRPLLEYREAFPAWMDADDFSIDA
jgi:predicted amidohydrolase